MKLLYVLLVIVIALLAVLALNTWTVAQSLEALRQNASQVVLSNQGLINADQRLEKSLTELKGQIEELREQVFKK